MSTTETATTIYHIMNHQQLTVEILKTLPFSLSMHLNGGSSYSKRVSVNDAWDLGHVVETSGSPHYRVTGDMLYLMADPTVCLDLRAKDKNLQAFCDAYNGARTLRLLPSLEASDQP